MDVLVIIVISILSSIYLLVTKVFKKNIIKGLSSKEKDLLQENDRDMYEKMLKLEREYRIKTEGLNKQLQDQIKKLEDDHDEQLSTIKKETIKNIETLKSNPDSLDNVLDNLLGICSGCEKGKDKYR